MRCTMAFPMVVAMVMLTVLPAPGQAPPPAAEGAPPAAAEEPGPPPEVQEQMQQYLDMGMERDQALLFALMGSGDMDPTQMMMLMMVIDSGHIDDDFLGFMMMDAIRKGQSQPQPVVIDRGGVLLIVEGGVLYEVNPETMEVEGRLAYARGTAIADILPWLMMGRPEPVAVEEVQVEEGGQ